MNSGEVRCGALDRVSFPELLRHLHDSRFDGEVRLSRERAERWLLLHQGRVVFARSNNPDDRLGEFLLRRGIISLGHYLESARQIGPGRRQGAILCEMGAISAEDLVRHVTEQVTEILYAIFRWSYGEFEIREPNSETQERIVLAIPFEDVILQGIRRVSEWARVWRGIGEDPMRVFAPTPLAQGLGYRASLSDDDSHILSLINGALPVARVVELSYTSNFETCRTLWALTAMGAIEPVASGAEHDSSAGEDYVLIELVEEFDRVLSFIHGFVTERIGELVDHVMERAARIGTARHPGTLAGIDLRNQARVEYEQIFANLAGLRSRARRERAATALGDLVAILVALTARELGPDEDAFLRDQLALLAVRIPAVPLAEILALSAEQAEALVGSPDGPYNERQ